MAFENYDHKTIEKKWQDRWLAEKTFKADNDSKKPKQFILVEFPYPSGVGLHVGHVRSYTALDAVSRKKRMEGFNVLYPMGWDAFGLPAENYALKTGIHPRITTQENIATFRRQLQALGLSFDWDREVDTTDPKYYRWTQWMFLEFFRAGMAYKAKTMINWCPKDKCGLANEEVVAGACERCGTPVEKREKEQWMIRITKYADRLIDDLNTVNYLPKIKKSQEDWIGRSEGAEIDFALTDVEQGSAEKITVFTTRPDTLFGVTYVVLAPENPLVAQITTAENKTRVEKYVTEAGKKSEADRGDATKEKTGVATGAFVVNPATGKQVPVWVADYVLNGYGTGAVMAVPAHDERDAAFAEVYKLPVVEVIEPETGTPQPHPESRESIVAIVRNPKTNQFVSLNWGSQGGNLFVGGGRENGEDAIECAKREIMEETGYANLKFVSQTGVIHHNYFAKSKNVARRIQATGLLFDLVDETKSETKLEANEKNQFTVELLSDAQIESKIKDELHATVYKLLVKGESYTGEGVMKNSEEFNGENSETARKTIVEKLAKQGSARVKVVYKLRDWVFSRQRYWGEPIPLIKCESNCAEAAKNGGWVAVPDTQLPVTLPEVEKYQPTDNGESPLATIKEFVETTCPNCGGKAKRETDTMPQWAGSCWYYLRYTDAHNDQAFASKDALKYWTPVDIYNGGMEHTTLHLLYSRFWHKFLFDRGHVPTPEPYARRHSHGLITAEGGAKMSKSKGNATSPDEIVKEFGADTLRVYEMFMGPFEEVVPWSTDGLIGVRRFLDKIERYMSTFKPAETVDVATAKVIEKTIKKITDDINDFKFNTAVSAFMILANELPKLSPTKEQMERVLAILSPLAPHLANELWERLGHTTLVEAEQWPIADAKMLIDETAKIIVQVNGKVRGAVEAKTGASQEEVLALVGKDEKIQTHLAGKTQTKIIYVPNRLINIVVE